MTSASVTAKRVPAIEVVALPWPTRSGNSNGKRATASVANGRSSRAASSPRRRLLGSDPDDTAAEVFPLPDRYGLLQPVDQPVTRGEGFGPVRRRHRDRDARLTHRHDAHPVGHGDPAERPPAAGLRRERPHLAHGHRGEGLVLEPHDAAPVVLIAGGPEEGDDGARAWITHGPDEPPEIERHVGQVEHAAAAQKTSFTACGSTFEAHEVPQR